MKTVLITGSSSGIGKATAKLFQSQGWKVIATMRKPEQEKELQQLANVHCVALDVTQLSTIHSLVDQITTEHGHIDVLVNNAGYGLIGALECATQTQIENQITTNITGLMVLSQKLINHFRQNGKGTIVNISSVGGKLTFPFYSSYHATKWAVEGLSESLQFELQPLNIKVKIVEPGVVNTDFFSRSLQITDMESIPVYKKLYQKAESKMDIGTGSSPEHIAEIIFQAATSTSNRLRYKAGKDAKILIWLRKIVGENMFQWIMRKFLVG
jgi:short-subunit dehydrogenase